MRSSPLFIAAALVLLTAACSDPASNDSNNGTTNNGTTNSGTSTNGDTSGANVATNGDTNGAPNGETNGNTNGNPNGETNGSTNGQTNGTNNGTTNTNNGGCPDALEPNDTRDEATPVSSGDVVESRLCDDDDLDLFAIDLTDGQTLTASATFEANTHNLDMTLFTEEQAADFTTGDTGVAFTFAMGETPEVLEHAVDADGTYYLLIFNNNFVAAEYTLEFDVE
jgi:hypothetical protein